MRPRRFARVRRGFTMLEMMLVLVVIGIIAGVAIYNLAGATTNARIQSTKLRLRQLMTAIQAYNGMHAVNPQTLTVLATPPTGTLTMSGLKDGWKEDFIYSPVGTSGDPQKPFDLYSKGPDKLPSTADDIDGWAVLEAD
ncbi:MAG: type II secretion system protein GspG [Phycisphaerae bacterium]|nr:type II secretion system protein GspG [Phycisphaerae bacterium]